MNPSQNLGDLLIAINKEIKTKVERDLKQYGIGMGQLQILMVFFAHTESTFMQNELAKTLNVDKGNISRSIRKLLDNEYLEYDSINKKAYRLSSKGNILKSEIISCFTNINRVMTLDIEEQSLKEAASTLTQMLNNLEVTG